VKSLLAYVRDLIADPLFFRICMFLWGLPFAALSACALFSWRPSEPLEWLGILLVLALGIFGLVLMFVSVFGSEHSVDKTASAMADGGEIAGLVLAVVAALFALPITILLRALKRRSRKNRT
jgi:drug/metabolite transporter (DMT)-like permease